jgi:general secretion pathway protein B
VSFILDALRKSEHERQRSAVPGLAQVPLATPQPQMPRWALAVIGALGAAVLALGAAWWQSARSPAAGAAASATVVERDVELPPAESSFPRSPAVPRPTAPAPTTEPANGAHAPASAEPFAAPEQSPLERAALSSVSADGLPGESGDSASTAASAAASTAPGLAPRPLDLPADGAALPSAAALAAEGVQLPPLRLELHAFSAQPEDRFVFVNGRKYVEGERLAEGPQVVSIEPTGVVLAYAGRRFLLIQD